MKHHKQNTINILTIINDRMVDQLCVLLYSTSINTKHKINFYVSYLKLKDNSKNKLIKITKSLNNCNINFIEYDQAKIYKFPFYWYWPNEVWLKLFVPQILNEDRVLYLDADIVVINDISRLFYTNLNNKTFAACLDKKEDEIRLQRKDTFPELASHYINAGVLLIDINKFKTNFNFSQVEDLVNKRRGLLWYLEQDVINCLYANEIKYLDATIYNKMDIYSYEKDNKIDRTIIVHFSGSYKPWVSFHPKINKKYIAIYKKYAKLCNIHKYPKCYWLWFVNKIHNLCYIKMNYLKHFKKLIINLSE